jgi:hypothetical protein
MISFVYSDSDLHIASSDGISFHVHKKRMSLASPVFADMFSFPTPDPVECAATPTVTLKETPRRTEASVELTESSGTLEDLLHFIYDTDKVKPDTMLLFNESRRYTSPLDQYQRLASLFEAACKYEVESAQRAVVDALQ